MLIICSQNGEVIVPLTSPVFVTNENHIVFGEASDKKAFLLGEYSTKTRCIEIINQIMEEFQYSNHFSGSGISRYDCQNWEYGVYIMPKE